MFCTIIFRKLAVHVFINETDLIYFYMIIILDLTVIISRILVLNENLQLKWTSV
jgi:hypothetical protein